ncbi:MAG: hypothetical protein FJ291_11285 [Planctomycetes bacterium]|nr:hypothetical protein [Planctomycetota bacterium]
MRDLIPVQIKAHGERVRTYRVTPDELIPLLKAKAVEEALEFYWEADPSKAFSELADILEVVQAACRASGRDFSEVLAEAERKRGERGGFSEGVVLVETEELPLISRTPPQSTLFQHFDGSNTDRGPARPPVSSPPQGRGCRVTSGGLVIPLIPPDPLEPGVRKALRFPDSQHEIVAVYGGKEVTLTLRPRRHRESDRGQLWLFPP